MGYRESSANTSTEKPGNTQIPASGLSAMTGRTPATTPTSCGRRSMQLKMPVSAVAVDGRLFVGKEHRNDEETRHQASAAANPARRLAALRIWQRAPELTEDLAEGIAISISKVEAAIQAAERNK